jgi:hypothetical protein
MTSKFKPYQQNYALAFPTEIPFQNCFCGDFFLAEVNKTYFIYIITDFFTYRGAFHNLEVQ